MTINNIPPAGGQPREVATRVNQLIQRGTYLTTETPTGVWVDGRTVYRKVVQGTARTASPTTAVASASMPSYAQVVEMRAVMTGVSDQVLATEANSESTANLSVAINATGDMMLTHGLAALSAQDYTIIWAYTKTTDPTF